MTNTNRHPKKTKYTFLHSAVDINSLDSEGHTALFYAVESCDSKRLRILLDCGADPNKAGSNTFPPLAWAAGHNYKECTEILLKDHQTDVNTRQIGNATALFMAVRNGHEEMVDLLLSYNADPRICLSQNNTPPLVRAIADGYHNIVKKIVTAMPQIVNDESTFSNNGFSHLHKAVQANQLDTVSYLLNAGAKIDALTKTGATAVFIAAQDGYVDILRILLEKGANYELSLYRDSHGQIVSPLNVAKYNGHVECVLLLLTPRLPKSGFEKLPEILEHITDEPSKISAKSVVNLAHTLPKNGHTECVELLAPPLPESEFEQLPPEMLKHITDELFKISPKSVVNLALALPKARYAEFFKPQFDTQNYLHQVALANESAMRNMLKQDIELITRRGLLTDCAKREFDNISGFEYALWAKDKHLWTMMLDCIEETADQEIYERLLSQYLRMKTNGVSYRYKYDLELMPAKKLEEKEIAFNKIYIQLNKDDCNSFFYTVRAPNGEVVTGTINKNEINLGADDVLSMAIVQTKKINIIKITADRKHTFGTITEKHFDFENTIMKELQTQADLLNLFDSTKADEQWVTDVGSAQRLLPLHVVDFYYLKTPFYDILTRKINFLVDKPKIINCSTDKYKEWFGASKLGIDFAKDGPPTPERRVEWQRKFRGVEGFGLMKRLCRIRTQDFIDLESQLKKKLCPDNEANLTQGIG